MVTAEIVERVYNEVSNLPESKAGKEMTGALDRQEELFSFVVEVTEELSTNASELAVYLTFILLRMFEKSQAEAIASITPEEIDHKWEENHELFERLGEADEELLPQVAQQLRTIQPHATDFVLDALMGESEEEDPDHLSEDEVADLFFVLKTVIDLLHAKAAA